jgi:hypothetical protein
MNIKRLMDLDAIAACAIAGGLGAWSADPHERRTRKGGPADRGQEESDQ